MTQTTDTFPAPLETGEAPLQTANAAPPRADAEREPAPPETPAPDYGGLKLPEGAQAEDGALDAFKTLAGELNIAPETAQKLMDWEFERACGFARAAESRRQEILQNWADQTKAALGARYEENLACAVRAADAFGGPELRALLEETGLGNHPVIVKTFCQIGRATGEDASAGGKEAASGDKTFAEALYGSN